MSYEENKITIPDKDNLENWLEVIWSALYSHRETCIPEGLESFYDEEWKRIFKAMSFVTKALDNQHEPKALDSKITKAEPCNINNVLHDRAEKIIEQNIHYNQSSLIFNFLRLPNKLHDLMADSYDGFVQNLLDEEGIEKIIYEWWLVSEWLADNLNALGEPVIFTDFGTYWGRTCTGQRIVQDGTIQDIIRNL